MSSFSEYFKEASQRLDILSDLPEPCRELSGRLGTSGTLDPLQLDDAAALIAWARDPDRRALVHAAAQRSRAGAPQTVEFIIPVYLTSFCRNECLYCGYRRSNPVAERVRLSLDDLARELDLILAWGHRQIELVLSDDPEFGAERVARSVELTRRKLDARGGGMVALCAPVYTRDDYARLRDAGLDWLVEWQETYHQPHFDRWHVTGSEKRQFEFRLDIWDRAIGAGIRQVAFGALLGLYDWRYDALAAIEHGNYLRRTYGLEPHALGIPRLKPARGVLASQKPSRFAVSDDEYRFIVSLYHLAFPRARLFFNTREDYDFNLSMVLAGDLFTVDCETLPGGYLRPRLPGQFSTHAYPSRREVAAALERRGFVCKYLAPETALPQVEETAALETDPERWNTAHREIRAHLDDWETILDRLAVREAGNAEHKSASAALSEVLHFFKTSAMAHCREEENELFPVLAQHEEDAAKLQSFRGAHERLGIDLDKFERQVISYDLSGDPSVLLTLGERIIRELRAHLDAEEELTRNASGTRPAVTASQP
ncbi:MAG: hemerythrin domain-containing protein [Acidobacteriia bacterium]|nr:hemerythrin domain-containing protein [Terriglobia bacterium]